jgi:predicted house-cleaning noncanonical NTP pyrophosphatase (MazG superfamily)
LSIAFPRCQWPAVELHQRILARGRDFVGKLVRDGIPSIIRSAGRAADVRALDTEDFGALGDKLVEEVAELRAASDADAVVEEAADVLEVLLAIVAEHGGPSITSSTSRDASASNGEGSQCGFGSKTWIRRRLHRDHHSGMIIEGDGYELAS